MPLTQPVLKTLAQGLGTVAWIYREEVFFTLEHPLLAPSLHLMIMVFAWSSSLNLVVYFGLPKVFFYPLCFSLGFLPALLCSIKWGTKLRKFPGPFLWGFSRLPMFYSLCRGQLPYKIHEFHEKYGPIVRIAPTELSFIDEAAWAAIYSKQQNKPQLQKDPTQFLRPTSGIGGLFQEQNDTEHGRIRRNFSHAFSENSMRTQEPVIQSYIGLFIARLRERVGTPIDLCKWYDCLTFDVIGDLVFGDSFHSLEDSEVHPWIKNIFHQVAGITVLGMIQKFEPLSTFLFNLIPAEKMRAAEVKVTSFVNERIDRRLRLTQPRPDFITHVKKFLNTPTGISIPELQQSCNSMIIAGSETTSTLLSGCTYFLLRNPRVLANLTAEIRSSFTSSTEIAMAKVQKLEYQRAVLHETFRLFSPTPGNLTRVTPENGWTICDEEIPPGTLVGIPLFAAGHSSRNFARAGEFIPERWLKNAPVEFQNDRLNVVQGFSVGPRNCIGKNLAYMEMRLILAHMLFEFDIALKSKSKKDWLDMKVYGFYQRRPLMVQFTPVAGEVG